MERRNYSIASGSFKLHNNELVCKSFQDIVQLAIDLAGSDFLSLLMQNVWSER